MGRHHSVGRLDEEIRPGAARFFPADLQGGSGQETLELWPGYGEWTSDSFSHTLSGVETITANASGQDDTARLHDSDKLDTFVADPDSATLSGDGITNVSCDVKRLRVFIPHRIGIVAVWGRD